MSTICKPRNLDLLPLTHYLCSKSEKVQHHPFRNDMKIPSLKLLSVLIVLTSLSLSSCDTPQSIAWTHYYCAVDAMKEGKLDKAKHFLEMVDKNRDHVLADKTDSLMKVIEEEMKNHTFSDH